MEQHLTIIENMYDRYSYGAYVAECKNKNVEPLTISKFACLSGRVGVALVMHYDVPLPEAYARLMRDEINLIPRFVAAVESVAETVTMNESRGLGDTVAKITHATGIDKLAALYTQVTGKDCGCTRRQEFLNKLVPYGIKEE